MFDKFDDRCRRFGWRGQYARKDHYWRWHHARFVRYVTSNGLLCQECGGGGKVVDDVIPGVGTVYGFCDFCEGTGFVTRRMRGYWLRWKRQEKRAQMATR